MHSKFGRTVAGQQELVDLVADKIEINESFDPLEEGTSNTDRLVLCVESILPLFNVSFFGKFYKQVQYKLVYRYVWSLVSLWCTIAIKFYLNGNQLVH